MSNNGEAKLVAQTQATLRLKWEAIKMRCLADLATEQLLDVKVALTLQEP